MQKKKKSKAKSPKAKSEKFVLHTTYYKDHEGNWTKKVNKPQCPEEIFLTGQCQGSKGHDGDHWCYRSDGSYSFRHNKNDPRAKRISGGWTPPGHQNYVSPLDMADKFHMCFYDVQQVTSKRKIAELEKGKMEEGACINSPCTEEEIKWLKDNGRLDDILNEWDEEGCL